MDTGNGRRSQARSPRGMGTPDQTHEHLYKILVIGDFGVGEFEYKHRSMV